jgi:hypothetical protein
LVTYPITVDRSSYRGSDRVKILKAIERNKIASRLEEYINNKLKNQEASIKSYSYHEISSDTGVPLETVRDLCFSIDCGHNGFTAIRHGLTLDEAMESSKRGE